MPGRICYTYIGMNYYDDILDQIKDKIDQQDYEDAKRLILNELDMPYVPKEFEKILRDFLMQVCEATDHPRKFSEEEILSFLNKDEKFQLIAVSEMDRMNLRNHIESIARFLADEERSANAKALLIDSLIAQQIDEPLLYRSKDKEIAFVPKDLKRADQSECFAKVKSILEEEFMKEPSKLRLAMQLLYKEAMLYLPLQLQEKDSASIGEKIISFINKAFES